MADDQPRALDDDLALEAEVDPTAWVTQLGQVDHKIGPSWHRVGFRFRGQLRDGVDDGYMSAILGRRSVAEVVRQVAPGDKAGSADAVRYARVTALLAAGFKVKPMPTDTIPNHVGVFANGDWTPEAFATCFNDYTPGPRDD